MQQQLDDLRARAKDVRRRLTERAALIAARKVSGPNSPFDDPLAEELRELMREFRGVKTVVFGESDPNDALAREERVCRTLDDLRQKYGDRPTKELHALEDQEISNTLRSVIQTLQGAALPGEPGTSKRVDGLIRDLMEVMRNLES